MPAEAIEHAATPRLNRGRDPVFLLALIAPLLLLPLMAGARLGEPVADDYDYLHHVLLSGSWSWFDGCGSSVYWRPLARQAYYAILAPWMLERPGAVALLQLACLCAAAGLWYRAFRGALGRATALAVSTAPWMMESSRLLIAWPSAFQDLGALLFVALAVHEAVAGRRWRFLAASGAALLCKEVAAVAVPAILLCPAVDLGDRRRQRAWILSTAVLVAAWAAVYLTVHVRAGLAFPGSGGVPMSERAWDRALVQVPWWSFKAIWSRPPTTGWLDLVLVLGLAAMVPWARVRARFAERPDLRAWWRWGLLWTLPLLLTLLPFHPAWWPYRVAFVALGALIATVVTLAALHRHALTVFVLLRLALLVVAPRPVAAVAVDRPLGDAAIDVPQLSRLQRFGGDVRSVLRARFPTLPHGAAVAWENFPRMAEYAFGSRPALQVWYRDTTLRWLPLGRWIERPSEPVAAVVEFQPGHRPEVALVEPDAMRALLAANQALIAGDGERSLRWLARADSLQPDTSAAEFHRAVAGKRAFAEALIHFRDQRYDLARERLEVVLALYPGDVPSRRLLARIDEIAARPSP